MNSDKRKRKDKEKTSKGTWKKQKGSEERIKLSRGHEVPKRKIIQLNIQQVINVFKYVYMGV